MLMSPSYAFGFSAHGSPNFGVIGGGFGTFENFATGSGTWADLITEVGDYQWPTGEVSFNVPGYGMDRGPSVIQQSVTNTAGSTQVVEPPPGGYPKIIVHPERPNAPFALIEKGWYRSPTGDVVPYKTVADYLLTAQSADRADLLRRLGQLPGGFNKFPVAVIAVAVGVGLLLVRRR